MKKFILGFITGGIICATATGFAVEYAVTANPFPVAVNGTETAIEGYNTIIHILNYVTLPTLSAVSMLVSVTTQSLLIQIPPPNQHRHRHRHLHPHKFQSSKVTTVTTTPVTA